MIIYMHITYRFYFLATTGLNVLNEALIERCITFTEATEATPVNAATYSCKFL